MFALTYKVRFEKKSDLKIVKRAEQKRRIILNYFSVWQKQMPSTNLSKCSQKYNVNNDFQ